MTLTDRTSSETRIRVAIVLSALALVAFFLAQGTMQIAGRYVFDRLLASAPTSGTNAARPTTVARAPRDGHSILERNIFDSVTGSIPWDPPVEVTETTEVQATNVVLPPPSLDNPPPACEGSMRLVGTYVRPGPTDNSFAAIIGTAGTSLLYRQGGAIDGKEVMAIGPHLVILRPNTSSYCSLSMFNAAAVAQAHAPAAPESPVVLADANETAEGGLTAAELDQGIHQNSETNYTVNRSILDRLLANQSDLIRSVRVIPHEENGRMVGVKVYGIRRSSVLGRIGVQNGDMLRSINGYDLSQPDQALTAYTKLRSATQMSLSMDRRGQQVTMEYQVH